VTQGISYSNIKVPASQFVGRLGRHFATIKPSLQQILHLQLCEISLKAPKIIRLKCFKKFPAGILAITDFAFGKKGSRAFAAGKRAN
jgi:hypothetical protein